ncbi:MAG: TonB-dependent receptor [Ponticaulis sp.]|nr:TonB-dependent receptor [Ponticaulis sp.]
MAQSSVGDLANSDRQKDESCDRSQQDASDDTVILCHPRYALTRLNTIQVIDRAPRQPGSFGVIEQMDITNISADHPAELLNTLPGVNIQMNSGQEHLIALRSPVLTGGAGQGSFLILQNGVPTRSPAFGNVNMLFEVHHEIAETVEVVRGPASAKYGSNAVHGLINFILPQAIGGRDPLELRLSGSTLGRYKADMIAEQSIGGEISVASVSLQHDEGWRDDTGVDQQKLTFAQSFDLGDWDGQAWFSFVNLNQETGGYVVGPDAYEDLDFSKQNANPEAFRDAKFAMGAVEFFRTIGSADLTITPYARWQEMEFRQHFLPYKGFEENSHSGYGVMARIDGGEGATAWRLGGMFDAATGDLKETQPAPFGFFPGDMRFPVGDHYDYTVDTLAAALWGEVEFAIAENVRVLGGLRAEFHEYDYTTRVAPGISGRFLVPADRTDSFDLVTPKLGIVVDDAFNDVDLYANYARGQRAPQASDLYRLQSQQTAGTAEPETLDSFEIGLRGTAFDNRLAFDLAGYTARKKNYFFRDSDGLNVTDGVTEHMGVELLANMVLTDQLDLSGTLTWADHTYAFDRPANGIVDGNQIDTAPEWQGDLSLSWSNGGPVEASLSAEFVGEYFTDEAASVVYDGHVLMSARGAYDVTDHVELFVIVRNLFDERYADRADFAFGNERYFPGEPLNATFGMRANW